MTVNPSLSAEALWVAVSLTLALKVYSVPGNRPVNTLLSCQSSVYLEFIGFVGYQVTLLCVLLASVRAAGASGPSALSTAAVGSLVMLPMA